MRDINTPSSPCQHRTNDGKDTVAESDNPHLPTDVWSQKLVFRESPQKENEFNEIRIPKSMTDQGLETFLVRIDAKERIKKLDLHLCSHITGVGSLDCLKGSQVLEFIDLRGVPNLDQRHFAAVIRESLQRYRLRLIKCS